MLAVLLAVCPETVERSAGAVASLRPRVLVPPGRGRTLFAVGAALVGTWALSGFYQAFSPVLAADELRTTNALIVALVFSSIVVLSPIGGLLTGRIHAVITIRIGLAAFVAATAAVLLTLNLGQITWFLVASAVAGIAQGAANAGGMRAILSDATPGDRAGLLATLYLVSYSGAAAPGLIAGQLATFMPFAHIAFGYGALVAVAAIIAVLALPPGSRRRS
jgi:MFS family permease